MRETLQEISAALREGEFDEAVTAAKRVLSTLRLASPRKDFWQWMYHKWSSLWTNIITTQEQFQVVDAYAAGILLCVIEHRDLSQIFHEFAISPTESNAALFEASRELLAWTADIATWKKDADVALLLAEEVLSIWESLCGHVKGRLGKFPATTVQVDAWLDGYYLAYATANLAGYFQQIGRIENELRAWTLSAHFTTKVLGHYPQDVTPIMNSLADCLFRMGRTADAVAHYKAAVLDFDWIIDDYLQAADSPSDADRFTLERLRDAYEHLQLLSETSADVAERLNAIARILGRSSKPDGQD